MLTFQIPGLASRIRPLYEQYKQDTAHPKLSCTYLTGSFQATFFGPLPLHRPVLSGVFGIFRRIKDTSTPGFLKSQAVLVHPLRRLCADQTTDQTRHGAGIDLGTAMCARPCTLRLIITRKEEAQGERSSSFQSRSTMLSSWLGARLHPLRMAQQNHILLFNVVCW